MAAVRSTLPSHPPLERLVLQWHLRERIAALPAVESRAWLPALDKAGLPEIHFHDLRHTGNTFAAQSGASLRDLMTRMGHDSPAAALIYQHSSRVADEAIAAALDVRLSERKSRLLPKVVGPVEGPTEPQLIAFEPDRSRKTASDQG